MQVPPFSLGEQLRQLGDALDGAVLEVLRSGQYIGGATIGRFEQEFAASCAVPQVIGCNSGTDALILALRGLGIGPGDEVITCSFSFFATAEAISAVGATPVFVDVDEDTYLIALDRIEAAITPATKALLPVHLFGQPVDMERLCAIAAAHDLLVIEDCAQCHGAKYQGRQLGCLGDIASFSTMFGKHHATGGQGGVVFTKGEQLFWKVRQHADRGKPFGVSLSGTAGAGVGAGVA